MLYDTPDYKRYRNAYVTQCTVEHLVGLLVLDAFLAKLLTHLEIDDALAGIIASFTSIAFVFQLFSVLLVRSRFSTKRIVMTADIVSQMLFAFIYFVPFLPLPLSAKKITVVVAVMVAQIGKSLISSLYFKWANTYVNDSSRAIFSAKKECISLITGIAFSGIMAFVIDMYEDIGNIEGGLLFIASTLLALNLINIISLATIKDEEVQARKSMNVPVKEVCKHIISNKIFFRYTVIDCISSFAGGLLVGFIGVYKIKELAFSLFAVQLINIFADFMRMAFSMPFAKFSDKYGFANGLLIAEILNSSAIIVLVFTMPQTRFLIIPYTLLTTVALAGSYQNSYNIGYTLLPAKYMVQAMSVKRTATGITSFLSAILGGFILNSVQKLNLPLYGQQVLALVSVCIHIPALILKYKYVIKPINKSIRGIN